MNKLNDELRIQSRIDSICDGFALALRDSPHSESKLSIENLLTKHPDLPRTELLRQLLLEENDYRSSLGRPLTKASLLDRFPGDAVLIEQIFTDQTPPRTPDGTTTAPGDIKVLHPPEPPVTRSFSERVPEIRGFEFYTRKEAGTFGLVYHAFDRERRREVAIKVLKDSVAASPRERERFKLEIQALSRLRHPGIVQIHDSGTQPELCYYVMDYIESGNLAQKIADANEILTRKKNSQTATRPNAAGDTNEPGLPPAGSSPSGRSDTPSGRRPSAVTAYPDNDFLNSFGRNFGPAGNRSATAAVVEIGIQVADAMHYVHDNRIVHRDLKPNNLLVDSAGRVYVADFGLAQYEQVNLTLTNQDIGTLAYMAPEQLQGNRLLIDARSDIFSLGATLYELLALTRLRDGETGEARRRQALFETPVPLRRRNSAVSKDLETIIHRAVAFRPDDRYATMQELADDLRRFQRREPIHAKPAGPLKRFSLWVEREQKLAASLAASAALLLVILGLLLAFVNSGRIHAKQAAAQESAAKNKAQQQAREAEAGRLVAWSHERRSYDPALAERLAITSAKLLPSAEASAAIILAMRQNHEVRSWTVHKDDSLVDGFVLNPDRTRVVVPTSIRALPSTKILVAPEFDVNNGTLIRNYGDTGHVIAARWSPDGRYLATVELLPEGDVPLYHVEIRIWPPDNAPPITLPRLLPKPQTIDQLTIAPDWPLQFGHLNDNNLHLITSDGTSKLKFFTVPQGTPVEPIDFPSLTTPIREIAFQRLEPSSGFAKLSVLEDSGLLTVCRLTSPPGITRVQLPANDRSTRITRLTTLRSGLTIAQFGTQLLLTDIPSAEQQSRNMRASSFHISRNESRILVVDNGDQSKLIDAQTGVTLADLKHDALLNLATLSDDGCDTYFTYVDKDAVFQTSLPGSNSTLASPRSLDTESGLLVAQEFVGPHRILQLTQTGCMTTLTPAPQSAGYTASNTVDGSIENPYSFDSEGSGLCVCATSKYFTLPFDQSGPKVAQLLQGRQQGPHAVSSTVATLTDSRTAVITYFAHGAVRKQTTIRLPTNSLAIFPATAETSFVLTEVKQLLQITHDSANYRPLTTPQETVTAISWNPVCRILCFSCQSGLITLYSPDTGDKTSCLAPNLQIITALTQSPEGQTIAAADSTGRLSVLSRTDTTITEQFTANVASLQTPDHIILAPDLRSVISFAGRGKTRRIMHFNTADSSITLSDEYSGPLNVFPLPDDKWLITSSEGLTEWSPKLQTSTNKLAGKVLGAGVLGKSIASLEARYSTGAEILTPLQSFDARAALHYVLCLRNLDTLKPLHEFSLPGIPYSISVDESGGAAHITLNRFELHHFAIGQNTPSARLLLDSRPVTLCSLTGKGTFACVTQDGNFHVWNPQTERCNTRRIIHNSIVTAAGSTNGHQFCAITSKGSLVWWRPGTDDVRELPMPNPQKSRLIVADHNDDTMLISSDGVASLISFSQTSSKPTITPLQNRVFHAKSVTASGQFLIVTAVGDEYELSLVPSRQHAKTLRLPHNPDAIAVSKDGSYCLLRLQGNALHLYKATETSWQLDRVINNPDLSESVRFEFSEDATRWIALSRKGVTVVSATTQESEFFIPTSKTRPLSSLSFYHPFSTQTPLMSPDGRWLIQPESSFELWPTNLSSARSTTNTRVLSDRERRLFGIQRPL